MKSKEAKWAIERIHMVTREVFYLSPGEVNWISTQQHQKYGTRYGRWLWNDAETICGDVRRRNPENFEYMIRLHANIN